MLKHLEKTERGPGLATRLVGRYWYVLRVHSWQASLYCIVSVKNQSQGGALQFCGVPFDQLEELLWLSRRRGMNLVSKSCAAISRPLTQNGLAWSRPNETWQNGLTIPEIIYQANVNIECETAAQTDPGASIILKPSLPLFKVCTVTPSLIPASNRRLNDPPPPRHHSRFPSPPKDGLNTSRLHAPRTSRGQLGRERSRSLESRRKPGGASRRCLQCGYRRIRVCTICLDGAREGRHVLRCLVNASVGCFVAGCSRG